MFPYCRFLFPGIITILVMLTAQPLAMAQSSGAEGEDLAAPWTMGNILVALFAIGLFALLVRTSRRDTSAIPDEFGKRPNPHKDKKKKKGKVKLDYSKGPIKHPELERATTLTIVAFFIALVILFSLPTAIRVRDEIKGDPRFLGESTANTLVILNYIWIGLWVLNVIATTTLVILMSLAAGQ